MRKIYIAILILLTAVSGLMLWNPPALAAAQATISIIPSNPVITETGQLLKIEVQAEDLTRLYSAEVHLKYDPAVISIMDQTGQAANSVSVGDLFAAGNKFVAINRINADTGTIDFAVTLLGKVSGKSGRGTICSFYVQALRMQASTLSIDRATLVGINNEMTDIVNLSSITHDAQITLQTAHQTNSGSTTTSAGSSSGGQSQTNLPVPSVSASVTIPPTPATAQLNVNLTTLGSNQSMYLPAQWKQNGSSYSVAIQDDDGELLRALPSPGKLQIPFDQAGLTPATKIGNQKICYWNSKIRNLEGGRGAWIAIPTTFDPQTKLAGATLQYSGTYALIETTGLPALTDSFQHWAEADIMKLSSLHICSGDPDGNFRPETSISREELAKLVVLAVGLQPSSNPELNFADRKDIAPWAQGYISTAVKAGIIQGYDDQTFRAKQSITRAEIAAMIMRALQQQPAAINKLEFTDAAEIPAWARPYVSMAAEQKIVTGFPAGQFKASATASRAQAAAMISRLLDK